MFFSQVCYQLTVTLAGVIAGKVWKESTTSFTLFEENLWSQSMRWRKEGCHRTGEKLAEPTGFLQAAGVEELISTFSQSFSQKNKKENSTTTEVSATRSHHLLLISSASLNSDNLSQRPTRQSNISLLSHVFCLIHFLWIPYIAPRKKKSSKAVR